MSAATSDGPVRAPRDRPRERGFALAAAIVLTLVGMLMAAAAYRTYSPVLRLEERRARHPAPGPADADFLTKGLDLLRSGEPPRRSYDCAHAVIRRGRPVDGVVHFRARSGGTWQISVERGPSHAVGHLPALDQ